MNPIGILGGTFDPIHFGHLRLAEEVCEGLKMACVRFVPTAVPPHRGMPNASPADRAEMVRLAIAGNDRFLLDERELKREGRSYTLDTLTALRQEMGETQPLCLVLGGDAFLGFASWYCWQSLFDLSHILLVGRPGTALQDERLPEALRKELARRRTQAEALRDSPGGKIALFPITALDISASHIRELLRKAESARYLLPAPVLDYIGQKGLYLQEVNDSG